MYQNKSGKSLITVKVLKDSKGIELNALSDPEDGIMEDTGGSSDNNNSTLVQNNDINSTNFSTGDGGKPSQGNIFGSPLFFFNRENSSRSHCHDTHLIWIIMTVFYLAKEFMNPLF